MSTDHYTLALLVPNGTQLPDAGNLSEIDLFRGRFYNDAPELTTTTHSRNNALAYNLERVLELSSSTKVNYFFQDFVAFQDDDLPKLINQISGLLELIKSKPELVVEATKSTRQHQELAVDKNGHMWCSNCGLTYTGDCYQVDGWVYTYRPEDILSMLENARVSMPSVKDGNDVDGEGYGYLFSMLKTHLFLAEKALQSDMCFVFENIGGFN